MKKTLSVFFTIGLFAALLGFLSWFAWTEIKKRRPSTVPETAAERAAAIETAFVDSSADSPPVEVDAGTRKAVDTFFRELGAAYQSGDSRKISGFFSADAMLRSVEQRGLADFGRGKERKAVLLGFEMGLEQGASQWAEMTKWDEHRISRIDVIRDGEVVVYGRFIDTEYESQSKLRWWLIRAPDGSWKTYDFEDFDSGIRMTAFMGIAFGSIKGGEIWMPKLVEAMQTLQALYMESGMITGSTVEMESQFREVLDARPPAEIEALSRLMLATAILAQERFEEALEELEKISEKEGRSPMFHYLRGSCLLGLERYDEALAAYEKYGAILGWDSLLYEMTAVVYLESGNNEEAVAHSLRGLEDNRNSSGCFATLASSLPPQQMDELDAHAEATEDSEIFWEIAIDYALQREDRKTADALFGRLKTLLPDSELVTYYGENEDLGTGIDVTEWTFEDWLNDDEVREQIEAKYTRTETFSEHLGELTPEQIESAVAVLTSGPETPSAWRLLVNQGENATPALTAALAAPAVLEPFAPEGSDAFEAIYQAYPANKLIGLLGMNPSPAAVKALAPLIDHPSASIRRDAASFAARIGTPECLELVRGALDDENEDIPRAVLHGVDRGVYDDLSSPEFRAGIFETLKKKLKDAGAETVPENIVWTLITLDKDAAGEFLNGPDLMRQDHPALHLILEGLNGNAIEVAPARLLEFLEHSLPMADESPADQIFSGALNNLSLQKHPSAKSWAERVLEHSSKLLRGAGIGAICNLEGLWDIDWYEVESQTESDEIRQLLEDVDYVYWIDNEVTDGGFEQFFGDTFGDETTRILDALNRVGGNESATLLRQAMARFGPSGPSADYEERIEKLDKILEADPKVFEALNEEWAKDKDRLEVIRNQHMLTEKDRLFAEAKALGLEEK